MRVRLALTLLFALTAIAAASDVVAQGPVPVDPASGAAAVVGHPRTAVLTLHDGAAEAFLLPDDSSAESPLLIHGRGDRVHLLAEYEAVFAPLTAGWARFALAAYLVDDQDEKLLDDDTAESVALGPSLRGGRLGVRLELEPGLHTIRLVSTAAVRPVGVTDWIVDRDTATVWVFVPAAGSAPPVSAVLESPAIGGALSDGMQPAVAAAAVGSDERRLTQAGAALPVGGLPVGDQRAAAGPSAAAAVNFDAGAGSVLRVVTGQPIRVWSDCELWLSEGAAGDAQCELSVSYRSGADSADLAPLASDALGVSHGVGPLREQGSLEAAFSISRPGTYQLAAGLKTWIRSSTETEDRDSVPFTVHVLPSPPVQGAIGGAVLGQDGTALPGVIVAATDLNGAVVSETRTNRRGRYLVERLAPAKYLVRAEARNLNYIGEWYDDSPTRLGADPVAVAAGATTPNIDFELTPGGTIAGRVVDVSGAGLGGIEVTVGLLRNDGAEPDPRSPSGATDPTAATQMRVRANDDGYYSVDRLREGIYWVRAHDPQGRYLTEYYDDKTTFGEADRVPVRRGAVTQGIDFTLGSGGAVAGSVVEQTVLGVLIPLPGMAVEARDPLDPERVIAQALTNREGRYRLAGLRDGEYLVRASDPSGGHVSEWFEEAASAADARPVPVSAGATTEPISFTLELSAAETRVFIDPRHVAVRAGQSARVAVAVATVRDLAAFETEVRWDPAVLHVDGVALADFLGSTGRRVLPVEPQIDNEAGRLMLGAATLGDGVGPSGDGVLFWFEVTGLERGETRLELSASTLADRAGAEIAHSVESGAATVGDCMFGDFDCNCVIDISDVMAVVQRWGLIEGDPDYDPLYDLDDDGDIDIVDVQIEAGLWGTRCSEAPGTAMAGPDAKDAAAHGAADPGGSPPGAAPGGRTTGGGATLIAPPVSSPRVGADPAFDLAGLLTAGATSARDPERPTGAVIGLTASPERPGIGQTVTVAVDITGAGEVAAFEIETQFDGELLRFVDGHAGEFLASTGRAVVQLGPMRDGSSVSLGAFSLPGAPAPSGGGRLVELRFEVLGTGDAVVEVTRAATVDPMNVTTIVGGAAITIAAGESPPPASSSYVPLVIDR